MMKAGSRRVALIDKSGFNTSRSTLSFFERPLFEVFRCRFA
jgi:hypothetical protein